MDVEKEKEEEKEWKTNFMDILKLYKYFFFFFKFDYIPKLHLQETLLNIYSLNIRVIVLLK